MQSSLPQAKFLRFGDAREPFFLQKNKCPLRQDQRHFFLLFRGFPSHAREAYARTSAYTRTCTPCTSTLHEITFFLKAPCQKWLFRCLVRPPGVCSELKGKQYIYIRRRSRRISQRNTSETLYIYTADIPADIIF